jgi:phosphopantothenoylcysteine decarboxylase/phosphopantothenate--cysteine ligase
MDSLKRLANKRVVLGVSGSIAAYKSAELVRLLVDAGADVQVVMTRSAQAFITPLTLQTLSGRPVRSELMDTEAESTMGHIALARWADVILVAPASADFVARLAQGKADDLLAALCLASAAPLAVAPAMNRQMWASPATRDNIRLLAARGIMILGPGSGAQACGEQGPGRMLEPTELVSGIATLFESGALAGLHVVVTAGPTREAIDPVRYISNRSSGKMGFAIAAAAVEAGASVTLVAGPVSLPTPERVTRIDIETAEQLQEQVLTRLSSCAIFIAAAAVADYRPVQTAGDKLKKQAASMTLELERTPDVLAAVAAGTADPRPFCVGFAAETRDLLANARDKLQRKGLDMVVANQVGGDSGFDVDENAVTVLWADGERDYPLMPKTKLARQLILKIAERYYEKNSIKNPG